MGAEGNKELVRRLVDEVVNGRDEAVLDEVADGEVAAAARGWIGPFRRAFPDFRMETVELIAEGDKVAAHLKCSGTHEGEWRGMPPTGRRFEAVDEVYIFTIRDGRLVSATAVQDNSRGPSSWGSSSRQSKPAPSKRVIAESRSVDP